MRAGARQTGSTLVAFSPSLTRGPAVGDPGALVPNGGAPRSPPGPSPNPRAKQLRPAMTTPRPRCDRFFGRDGDLAILRNRFARGVRLITVVGLAGVGKTRLAHEFALAESAAGGVAVVVDLSAARTSTEVDLAVAAALGLPGANPGDPPCAERIARALEARGVDLVVLDDFDGAASHGAATVG